MEEEDGDGRRQQVRDGVAGLQAENPALDISAPLTCKMSTKSFMDGYSPQPPSPPCLPPPPWILPAEPSPD